MFKAAAAWLIWMMIFVAAMLLVAAGINQVRIIYLNNQCMDNSGSLCEMTFILVKER